jgi:hypothetical protein
MPSRPRTATYTRPAVFVNAHRARRM